MKVTLTSPNKKARVQIITVGLPTRAYYYLSVQVVPFLHNVLARIRECKMCRKGFFAKDKREIYCRGKCKDNWHNKHNPAVRLRSI